MKLKRFVAPDMRTALAQIKEELGSEAVIMSNKRTKTGVEIIAGVDKVASAPAPSAAAAAQSPITARARESDSPLNRYLKDDEVTLGRPSGARAGAASAAQTDVRRTQAAGLAAGSSEGAAHSSAGGKNENFARSLLEILERQKNDEKEAAEPPAGRGSVKKSAPAPLAEQSGLKELIDRELKARQEELERTEKVHGISSYAEPATAGTALDPGTAANLGSMRQEIDEIRKLLQFQLAGLMHDSLSREQPVKAMVRRLLSSSGFDETIAAQLSEGIEADASFNFAWRELAEVLERAIKVGEDEIITDGGVITLIGPAGVGKTTTLAKLAARFVMNYGPDKVAIVTADHYRIGAIDQVKTYGRIMGCAAFAVKSLNELPEMLYSLRDKSLVLVDTAGVGLSDERFGTQLAQLKMQSKLKLKHYLVLPATAQRRVLEQAYGHFSDVGLKGVILTKIDESSSLGDALSLCLKHDLVLSYVTDGQRVPEDLSVPEPKGLALRALSAVENDAAQSAFEAQN
ncbi:MAG: flagellar biosynthesis protein FlhF [Succinivibrio sp.]|nr:flagellar biosynthesis protein FlhF [Succinivibrio sp.]